MNENILADFKAALAIGATTAANSALWLVDLIPSDIGKVGTVMGLGLTFCAIRLQVAQRRGVELDNRRKELEIAKLEAKD